MTTSEISERAAESAVRHSTALSVAEASSAVVDTPPSPRVIALVTALARHSALIERRRSLGLSVSTTSALLAAAAIFLMLVQHLIGHL